MSYRHPEKKQDQSCGALLIAFILACLAICLVGFIAYKKISAIPEDVLLVRHGWKLEECKHCDELGAFLLEQNRSMMEGVPEHKLLIRDKWVIREWHPEIVSTVCPDGRVYAPDRFRDVCKDKTRSEDLR